VDSGNSICRTDQLTRPELQTPPSAGWVDSKLRVPRARIRLTNRPLMVKLNGWRPTLVALMCSRHSSSERMITEATLVNANRMCSPFGHISFA
jgi:hypothetical protein